MHLLQKGLPIYLFVSESSELNISNLSQKYNEQQKDANVKFFFFSRSVVAFTNAEATVQIV